jgi:peptidoglycan/LPS O-acetylase OafA/YrhL
VTLGAALSSGRTGNLDTLRLMLAASVVVSHAWPLALGPGTPEPLSALTGHSLGGWAVMLFFFLSGLFVTASAERRCARAFWAARARRIIPGLGVALLMTLALAYASGARADAAEAASWVLRALSLVSIEHRLTGAFAGNPYPLVVNGPLWSLSHEVMAYVICFLLVASGVIRRPLAILGLVAGAACLPGIADVLPARAATFAPLFFAFALGMAAHGMRDRLPLHPVAACLLLPAALVLPFPLAVAAVAYACLTLALTTPEVAPEGDFSYGVYVYGWPVAQTVVHLQPGIGPVALAVSSLAATLPFAIASWYAVERPAIFRARASI